MTGCICICCLEVVISYDGLRKFYIRLVHVMMLLLILRLVLLRVLGRLRLSQVSAPTTQSHLLLALLASRVACLLPVLISILLLVLVAVLHLRLVVYLIGRRIG